MNDVWAPIMENADNWDLEHPDFDQKLLEVLRESLNYSVQPPLMVQMTQAPKPSMIPSPLPPPSIGDLLRQAGSYRQIPSRGSQLNPEDLMGYRGTTTTPKPLPPQEWPCPPLPCPSGISYFEWSRLSRKDQEEYWAEIERDRSKKQQLMEWVALKDYVYPCECGYGFMVKGFIPTRVRSGISGALIDYESDVVLVCIGCRREREA